MDTQADRAQRKKAPVGGEKMHAHGQETINGPQADLPHILGARARDAGEPEGGTWRAGSATPISTLNVIRNWCCWRE
jgi:hypothetical protein